MLSRKNACFYFLFTVALCLGSDFPNKSFALVFVTVGQLVACFSCEICPEHLLWSRDVPIYLEKCLSIYLKVCLSTKKPPSLFRSASVCTKVSRCPFGDVPLSKLLLYLNVFFCTRGFPSV